jgi:hypothetical protein
MKGPRGPLVLAIGLAILIVPVVGIAEDRDPRFSFWGNLPSAIRLLEHLPVELRFEPAPLVDPDDLAQCPVAPGESLVLIQNGKMVGRGRVGEIHAGWWARAGDDRVVFLVPEDLPDSLVIPRELPFPRRGDPEFDLYVIGDHEVHVLDAANLDLPPEDEFRDSVAHALVAGVFYPADFPPVEEVGHARGLPELPEAMEWLETRTELGEVVVEVNESFTVKVAQCDPYFVRVQTADHIRPCFLRGALDFFLEIDDRCYMVLRNDRPGTGMWRYEVHLLQPNALPALVYSDGSWST